MKKITRVVLLSTAIAFPIKIGFLASKDSSETARRKKDRIERVEKILANLQGGQNTSKPPLPDSNPTTLMKAVALLTGSAEPVLQSTAKEDAGKSVAERLPAVGSKNSPSPVPAKANLEIQTAASPSTPDSTDHVSSNAESAIDLSASLLETNVPVQISTPSTEIPSITSAPILAATAITGVWKIPAAGTSEARSVFEDTFSLNPEPVTTTSLPATEIQNQIQVPVAGPQQAPQTPCLQALQPEPKKMRVRLTFYSGKDDQWGSRVAWGKVERAKKGRTAAADPAIFPYGSWIQIPGFGKLRVEDTGSAVKARTASEEGFPVIDIYVGSEKEVLRLASCTPHYVEVDIL